MALAEIKTRLLDWRVTEPIHEENLPSGWAVNEKLIKEDLIYGFLATQGVMAVTRIPLMQALGRETAKDDSDNNLHLEEAFNTPIVYFWINEAASNATKHKSRHVPTVIPVFASDVGCCIYEFGDIKICTDAELLESVPVHLRAKTALSLQLTRNYLRIIEPLEREGVLPENWPGVIRKKWKNPCPADPALGLVYKDEVDENVKVAAPKTVTNSQLLYEREIVSQAERANLLIEQARKYLSNPKVPHQDAYTIAKALLKTSKVILPSS